MFTLIFSSCFSPYHVDFCIADYKFGCRDKNNIVHFCDDGDTGVRFDRDAWQEPMAEVESGNVRQIVLKDMTRWGRNYLEVGNYMELFRRKGIRFIAIGHNIDSDIPETLEFAPFINIMSEWYARDTSRKIKTVAHARGNAGKPLSYTAIYGYRKSPENKHSWIIDEIADRKSVV